ncbi:Phospholipase A2 group XV [Anthophora quadrimaculata]
MRLYFTVCTIVTLYCILSVKSWHLRNNQLSPVIFVPGDGGSQVEAKLNKTTVVHYFCEKVSTEYFNIWLNLELLVPVVIDCWIDNMKLIYDNITRTTRNQNGVDIRIPGWGDPFVVEYLDPSKASPGAYFKDISNMLVDELGYIRNYSIHGAPYDFRKGPNENEEFFNKLKELVEETYRMNKQVPVTLLAHTVWGGSVKALKVFAIGDDLGAYILRQNILKDQQISSPSLGWLLPSRLFWKESEVLVQTQQKNYTLSTLRDYLIDIGVPNAWEFRKDNEKYQLDFTAPGVEVHCLYGNNVDTVQKLYYKPGISIEGTPQLISGDGDGTVNLRSLEGCKHWQGKQKRKIYSQVFPGVNHMNILKNTDVLSYIKTVLKV